ncbi:MAG: 2,3-bisphosphoglycerate-independent phosphoglycerate mutase [Nitrosomonadales bacterium]
MINQKQTLTLLILDGFGHSNDEEFNAIALAKTPNLDELKKTAANGLINASENYVGLPKGQMGNSEVGHINIGAGRIVFQDIERINNSINKKELNENKELKQSFQKLKASNGNLHLMGLLSDGGVHSHINHLKALISISKENNINPIIHIILDGRDTPPKSAEKYIHDLEKFIIDQQWGQIKSVQGRFFAMDRDNRWERIEQSYVMLTEGVANFYVNSAQEALSNAYSRNETDEFVQPTIIHNEKKPLIKNNDMVIFTNFRSDRARQISKALLKKDFDGFKRNVVLDHLDYFTMTNYDSSLTEAKVIFSAEQVNNTFGEYIAKLGLTQLRIAETEKYPHVTFFFNGGIESKFKNEERILIPSPKVKTYDLQPEMSVYEVTKQLVNAISSSRYDVIICNFANGDMVGHTGDLQATIKAIEAMDKCIGEIVKITKETNGHLIVTADHGNAELMMDEINNQVHTQHTTNLVPFIYYGKDNAKITKVGKLSDIAPTMLFILKKNQPAEMTGENLIQFN